MSNHTKFRCSTLPLLSHAARHRPTYWGCSCTTGPGIGMFVRSPGLVPEVEGRIGRAAMPLTSCPKTRGSLPCPGSSPSSLLPGDVRPQCNAPAGCRHRPVRHELPNRPDGMLSTVITLSIIACHVATQHKPLLCYGSFLPPPRLHASPRTPPYCAPSYRASASYTRASQTSVRESATGAVHNRAGCDSTVAALRSSAGSFLCAYHSPPIASSTIAPLKGPQIRCRLRKRLFLFYSRPVVL